MIYIKMSNNYIIKERNNVLHIGAIMHLFSQSFSIVLRCEGQRLNATFGFSIARCISWPGFASIRVSCRCVIDFALLGWVCCTRLIQTRITVCSTCFHLLVLEFDIHELRPQLVHWSLKYQGLGRPNLQGVSCRPGSNVKWPSLHCVWHWNSGWVQGCSQPWLLPWDVFFQFSVAQVFVGLRKQL